AGDPAGGIGPTGGVHAGSDPASSVPTGGVLALVVPARSVPAGGVLAGSLVSTDSGASSVPAASVLVPAVVSTDSAATSPLPLVYSLGSCAHTTRFPSPSDLGNHQHTAGIFSSSSYDDDFCADVTNLDSNEMQQFFHQQVWKLVPLLAGKIAIGTKWILKNKRD
nr:hypothetical protein [Tanacetum cinerariifolium]